MIASLKTDAFASSAGALTPNHLLPTLVYYSFTTLTTTGYGEDVYKRQRPSGVMARTLSPAHSS